jgi:glycosyltransferase involved in cell wall biosynthesis
VPEPIKVAVIIPRLDQLGPVKVIQALVNSLRESDMLQIKVFYLDKTVDPELKMMVPVERFISGRFGFGYYDIIHTNGIRPDLIAFINRKKIRYHISTIHNFVFEDLAFLYNRPVSWLSGNFWLKLWGRADKLVCVSQAMKSYYEKWYASSRLEVIHNGIEEPDHSFIPDIDAIQVINDFRSRGLKVIGSAGILTRRKGLDQLLYLLSEQKEFALVIFGSGKELLNLQRLGKKLKISDRCHFCGFRSNAVTYFKLFDLFIIPSRSEGFGLTLIEAVQQKVPVVCSDLGVFKELFSPDEVTFFKLDDRQSLIEALNVSVETCNIKVDLAYTRYINNYTDKLMAKHYYELYRQFES